MNKRKFTSNKVKKKDDDNVLIKSKNGITLIALVISIIVMLILAGVSLNATIGENGIMAQAKNATYVQSVAVLEEYLNNYYVEHYDEMQNDESKVLTLTRLVPNWFYIPSMEGFGGSVAGGGRYDKMIGKFTGMDTPACGFSIGFERIVTILLDAGFVVPSGKGKEAWLFEKGTGMARLASIMKEAMAARAEGKEILLTQMNKNKKFQKDQLGKEGYTEFCEFYKEELKR